MKKLLCEKKITVSILCAAVVLAMLLMAPMTAFAESPTPLTFTATEDDSSVTLDYDSGSDVMYKLGNGAWTAYTKGTAVPLRQGQVVSFKGTNVVTDDKKHFSMTGEIAATGDVTSLTNGIGGDATLSDSCYLRMFEGCASLTTAPNLPATLLAEECYAGMFFECTRLTTAPDLPATSLAKGCYDGMFWSCTSLGAAPELPATTLKDECYYGMFWYCASLTKAPDLPATTLAKSCYHGMFENCINITEAPELPATTLVEDCYAGLFQYCSSLVTPPDLPATTLASHCYDGLFNGCSSLKVSDTKTGPYTKEWRIPTTGTATAAQDWSFEMLLATGGPFTGNPTVNTTYYLYKDDTAPVISGIEDGKTYCITAAFTVTDEDLGTVTVNGTEATAMDGKYVLTPGTNVVVATDKTGNSSMVTVTVNADHTWGNGAVTKNATATEKGVKTFTCTVCGETKTEEIAMLASSNVGGSTSTDRNGTTSATKTAQTGDSNNGLLPVALLLVSGGVVAVCGIAKRRNFMGCK